MNLHPIFVHFPIAMLTVYAVIELVHFKAFRNRSYVFHVKAVMLLGGFLGTIPAFFTGDAQLENQQPGTLFYRAIVVHSHWAIATIVIFGILAAAYVAEWLVREWARMPEKFKPVLRLHRFLTETPIAPIMALIGLAAVTVTGALGGSLAYGPDIDPIVSFIYKLLVK